MSDGSYGKVLLCTVKPRHMYVLEYHSPGAWAPNAQWTARGLVPRTVKLCGAGEQRACSCSVAVCPGKLPATTFLSRKNTFFNATGVTNDCQNEITTSAACFRARHFIMEDGPGGLALGRHEYRFRAIHPRSGGQATWSRYPKARSNMPTNGFFFAQTPTELPRRRLCEDTATGNDGVSSECGSDATYTARELDRAALAEVLTGGDTAQESCALGGCVHLDDAPPLAELLQSLSTVSPADAPELVALLQALGRPSTTPGGPLCDPATLLSLATMIMPTLALGGTTHGVGAFTTGSASGLIPSSGTPGVPSPEAIPLAGSVTKSAASHRGDAHFVDGVVSAAAPNTLVLHAPAGAMTPSSGSSSGSLSGAAQQALLHALMQARADLGSAGTQHEAPAARETRALLDCLVSALTASLNPFLNASLPPVVDGAHHGGEQHSLQERLTSVEAAMAGLRMAATSITAPFQSNRFSSDAIAIADGPPLTPGGAASTDEHERWRLVQGTTQSHAARGGCGDAGTWGSAADESDGSQEEVVLTAAQAAAAASAAASKAASRVAEAKAKAAEAKAAKEAAIKAAAARASASMWQAADVTVSRRLSTSSNVESRGHKTKMSGGKGKVSARSGSSASGAKAGGTKGGGGGKGGSTSGRQTPKSRRPRSASPSSRRVGKHDRRQLVQPDWNRTGVSKLTPEELALEVREETLKRGHRLNGGALSLAHDGMTAEEAAALLEPWGIDEPTLATWHARWHDKWSGGVESGGQPALEATTRPTERVIGQLTSVRATSRSPLPTVPHWEVVRSRVVEIVQLG